MRWRGVGLSFIILRRENTEEIINSTHEEKLKTFMAVDNGENQERQIPPKKVLDINDS